MRQLAPESFSRVVPPAGPQGISTTTTRLQKPWRRRSRPSIGPEPSSPQPTHPPPHSPPLRPPSSAPPSSVLRRLRPLPLPSVPPLSLSPPPSSVPSFSPPSACFASQPLTVRHSMRWRWVPMPCRGGVASRRGRGSICSAFSRSLILTSIALTEHPGGAGLQGGGSSFESRRRPDFF